MNNIIFIDETESFIIKSIGNELVKKGFKCTTIPWNVDEINNNIEPDNIIIAYIEDESEMPSDAMQNLNDLTVNTKCLLCFAGHNDDIDDVIEKYNFKEVAGKFCRPINANETAERIAAIAGDDPMLKRKHILAVDDSGTMLTTIQEWLGSDYRVSIVNSAMNALTFLDKNIPDLILLDYEMPGCSGPQLLEILRSDSRTEKIPVIFLTGKDDVDNIQQVLALKPSGYLLKTMPKEYIIEQVNNFFSKLREEPS